MQPPAYAFLPLVAIPLLLVVAVAHTRRIARWRRVHYRRSIPFQAGVPRANAITPTELYGGLVPRLGLVSLPLVAWLCAYAGWAYAWLQGPNRTSVSPPWFGDPLAFLRFALTGAVVIGMAIAALMLIVIAAYVLGRLLYAWTR